MGVDFTACSLKFNQSNDKYNTPYQNYTWNGTVYYVNLTSWSSIPVNKTNYITLEGCQQLCGTGNDYYSWDVASTTISTWILPITGILLQAPFESNRALQTLYAIARWIGSPIASLSYILWNIKVTGKCALLVDMATAFNVVPDDEDSHFAQIRDSLYILSVMNQYTIKPRMPRVEAEKLLRIALFSDSLQLEPVEDETRNLAQRRRKLARFIRKERRRGAVPVFVSLMWFLFSLAISLQSAFVQLGSNSGAHDLALGLLLAWVPVLILCSIVDRNPISADAIRIKLNRLLDAVGKALVNPDLRNTYIEDIRGTLENFTWTMYQNDEDYFHGDFFTGFAGQGRVRWHYGVAHKIIAGIEDSFVADYGRDWLHNTEEARAKLVKGPQGLTGQYRVDLRDFWQILGSIFIVCGTVSGAFILSFSTPTVGLGCRSGGYLIFCVIALGLFTIEMLCWWLIPAMTPEDLISKLLMRLAHRISRTKRNTWNIPGRNRVSRMLERWSNLTMRDRVDMLFFRPAELINTTWLSYIILAQTFGLDNNCKCQASTWGTHGGYIDLRYATSFDDSGVVYYWAGSVALSICVMLISFSYIIVEWCSQSHLSTENYQEAAKGLMTRRWWKKYTLFIRYFPDAAIEFTKHVFNHICKNDRRAGKTKSLVWAAKVKKDNRASLPVVVKEPKPAPDSHSGDDDEYHGNHLSRNENSHDSDYPMLRLSPQQETCSSSRRSSFGEQSLDLSMRPVTDQHEFI